MNRATIDVVIPVYKPGEQLVRLLRAIGKQTQPVHRVILINTEQAYFHEECYEGIVPYEVYHITREKFDHAATRSMGMQLAGDAQYVVMMTQDAIPADAYVFERLLEGMKARGSRGETVAVSYARQLPRKNCSLKEKYMRNFSYPAVSCVKTAADEKRLGIKTYFCSDVCAMYDRVVFESCGGYVGRAIFNEDMLFAYRALRAGYATHYVAEAKVVHSHDYNCIQQFKRHFDMGVSQAEHPEVFRRVSSEAEGVALVWGTCRYLMRKGHWYEIPGMLVNQASRYAGFICGKQYRILGKNLCRKLSSNPGYFDT